MIYLNFAKDKGIYKAIFDLPNVKLNVTNDVITTDYLDSSFMFHNGGKIVVDNLTDIDMAAKIIVTDYYPKWLNFVDSILQGSNLTYGTSTHQETTGNNTATNKVSAYDSNDLVNDGQTSQNNLITSDTTVTNLNDLNNLIELYQNNKVYDIINSDIRTILFHNIY